MKSELDALMKSHAIEAIIVHGAGDHNPAMVYFTGIAHLTRADLIIRPGIHPVLFHGPMERDEASKTGFDCRSYNLYPMKELLKTSGGDPLKANVERYRRILGDLGIKSGRVLLYGMTDMSSDFDLFMELQKALPDVSFSGDFHGTILPTIMATKDNMEIERIRRMGEVTVEVVNRTAEFICKNRIVDGVVMLRDGEPLTIGEVKKRINLWLSELGAENPEGTIFAAGRDAGIPHSSGNPNGILRAGETIVFDIFPCESGGGYFYDFTRTWCIGHATDEALQLYEQVLSVYNQLFQELKPGLVCVDLQQRTCELFEALGHPTIQSNPETESGYVHSISHGLGLKVHEKPWFNGMNQPADIIATGSVFTLEPGLYYPQRGLGVRIEDTIWVTPEGKIETFVEYPKDLVLRIKA